MGDAALYEIADYLHRRIDEIDFLPRFSRPELERMLSTGDPSVGKAYFNGAGGCAGCHSATGDLKGIASKYDPIALELRFILPPERPDATVTLASGQQFKGQLLDFEITSVAIQGNDGQKHVWQRDTVKVELSDPHPKVTITLASGKNIRGQLLNLDAFSVSIQDEDGWNRVWDRNSVKIDVPDVLAAHRGRIPKYSTIDIHNLLAYLETMK